jgi:hypothetical protein
VPDLTLIYYTANLVPERFAAAVRAHLLEVAPGIPLVSVSHRPIEFGRNICVGEIGVCTYNVYRQVMLGAMAADTPFVACCEDDSLYTPAHFAFRPPRSDTFYYNQARWWVEPSGRFRFRDRTGMHACIADRKLMVETLTRRFARYPEPIFDKERLRAWGEPGRYEKNLNLPRVAREKFYTEGAPVLTFNHPGGLNGQRRRNATDLFADELAPWGSAKDVWSRFYGA